ncbi:FliG C-terminal domain-containing protein [Paramagnetospirillum magneticum]|uniref:Flagellar motor switch protein FliG C-terminal domain-containing protein n=1 Tax=Paramagnetospirillum magneticum (strain ATCC 700264 / AMB-1) TaxID=342108 RepID=Q2W2F7_PARM1|nr:FliG C-terminal domain-containing protein [Paramagnetospirillum magneticum]BAE51968.1 hypothetical protein amb3164 [Paramagnetospirillum magneticum AMB-1]
MSGIASIRSLIREAPTREAALALLLCLYDLWSLAKARGPLALEDHVVHPERSVILHQHRLLSRLPWLMEPLMDLVRHFTLGTDGSSAYDQMIDGIIAAEEQWMRTVHGLVMLLASVIAVFWVIAMVIVRPPLVMEGSLSWPTVTLWIVPMGLTMLALHCIKVWIGWVASERTGMLEALRRGICFHADGAFAPQVSADAARMALPQRLRPSHDQLENMIRAESVRYLYPVAPLLLPADRADGKDCATAIQDMLDRLMPSELDSFERDQRLNELLTDLSDDVPPEYSAVSVDFNRLSLLGTDGIRVLLHSIGKDMWAMALRGATSHTARSILDCISHRAGRLLMQDMEALDGATVVEILEAQRTIIETLRNLRATGTLPDQATLDREFLAQLSSLDSPLS